MAWHAWIEIELGTFTHGSHAASQVRLLAGTNVRLRHSYVVHLESFKEDELGNVAN